MESFASQVPHTVNYRSVLNLPAEIARCEFRRMPAGIVGKDNARERMTINHLARLINFEGKPFQKIIGGDPDFRRCR